MAAVASVQTSNPVFYERSLEKAKEIQEVETVIQRLILSTVVVWERHSHPEEKSHTTKAKNGTVQFHITKKLIEEFIDDYEAGVGNKKIAQCLRDCLKTFTLPKKLYYANSSKDNNQIASDLTQRLIIHYYSTQNFEIIPIVSKEKIISCHHYVLFRLNLVTEYQQSGNDDLVSFYMSRRYRFSLLPFQPNDVVLLYNESHELTHTSIVDKDPTKMLSRFGTDYPCAFRHSFDQTLFIYGKYYRILRQSLFTVEMAATAAKFGIPIHHY